MYTLDANIFARESDPYDAKHAFCHDLFERLAEDENFCCKYFRPQFLELTPRTAFDGPALSFDFPGLLIGVAEYDEGPTVEIKPQRRRGTEKAKEACSRRLGVSVVIAA